MTAFPKRLWGFKNLVAFTSSLRQGIVSANSILVFREHGHRGEPMSFRKGKFCLHTGRGVCQVLPTAVNYCVLYLAWTEVSVQSSPC